MNIDCSYNSFEEDKDINTEIDLESGSNLQECEICYEKKPLRLLFCGHEMCLECISSIQYVNVKGYTRQYVFFYMCYMCYGEKQILCIYV